MFGLVSTDYPFFSNQFYIQTLYLYFLNQYKAYKRSTQVELNLDTGQVSGETLYSEHVFRYSKYSGVCWFYSTMGRFDCIISTVGRLYCTMISH